MTSQQLLIIHLDIATEYTFPVTLPCLYTLNNKLHIIQGYLQCMIDHNITPAPIPCPHCESITPQCIATATKLSATYYSAHHHTRIQRETDII